MDESDRSTSGSEWRRAVLRVAWYYGSRVLLAMTALIAFFAVIVLVEWLMRHTGLQRLHEGSPIS